MFYVSTLPIDVAVGTLQKAIIIVDMYGFFSPRKGLLFGKMLFRLSGLLVHSTPMSLTQEGHMTQGEPVVGIYPFVHKGWSRDGHVTQANRVGILGQSISY